MLEVEHADGHSIHCIHSCKDCMKIVEHLEVATLGLICNTERFNTAFYLRRVFILWMLNEHCYQWLYSHHHCTFSWFCVLIQHFPSFQTCPKLRLVKGISSWLVIPKECKVLSAVHMNANTFLYRRNCFI